MLTDAPASTANGVLPELLDRMIAARQLTAGDARSFLRQHPAGDTLAEEAVLRWLAREYGVPFARLDELEPDKQVLSLFPARLLLRDELLPLRRVDNQIEIATSRLFVTAGLDGLRALTGLRLRPVLAPSEAVQRELKKRLGVGADTIGTLHEEGELQVVDEGEGSAGTNLDEAAEDASIIRFVNQVLKDSIELRAS
ncbi:MAG: type II/IV secretion system protein, partial [Opitutaceae bacterium]